MNSLIYKDGLVLLLGRCWDGMDFTLGDIQMVWFLWHGRCKDGLVYHLGRRWYSLVAIPWETYRWFDLRVPWETLVQFVFFPWETSNPLGDVDVSQGGTTSPKENHTSPKVNFPWETYQTLSRFYKDNCPLPLLCTYIFASPTAVVIHQLGLCCSLTAYPVRSPSWRWVTLWPAHCYVQILSRDWLRVPPE